MSGFITREVMDLFDVTGVVVGNIKLRGILLQIDVHNTSQVHYS
jgi:hypothetical protein